MDKVTIGAAIICGPNRIEQLQRLLPQLSAFDQVVVVNTSGQGAINLYVKKLAKKYRGVFEVYDLEWRPTPYTPEGEMYGLNQWGFSYARNYSMSKLKTTHAIWIDTDDVLGLTFNGKDMTIKAESAAEAFRKIAREAPDVDVWFADYHYSYDEHGNPNVVHARERMFRNPQSWSVVYPIHECFVPDHQPKHSIIQDIKFIHLPNTDQAGSSADRNMGMLQDWLKQLEVQENSHDLQRCRLLIGDTLWGLERFREAAHWLEFEFLGKHPEAIDIEKWQAATFACKSYISSGNLGGARRMALLAIDLEPGLMDGYLLLAEVKLLAEENPQDILHLIETGGRMDDPPPQVIRNPLDYTFTPFCITSECKFKLEQYEGALEFALKSLKLRPNDERAEALRVKAAAKLREKEASRAALALYQYLNDFDEHEKASNLFNLLPYVAQRQDEIHKVAERSNEKVAHFIDPEKYVAYYTDPEGWEPTPWEGFEKGYIPGRDRYNYILSRLKKRAGIKRVLVVGCDDGYHSILLAREGFEVVGIDLNSEAIRIAKERAEKLGVSAKFIQGWFEKIDPDETLDPFDDQPWMHHFDAIVASEQLDRVRDVAFFLETLGDCVKDGAPIIISTPDGAWDGGDIPHNRPDEKPKSIRAFTQDQLEALLRSNPDFRVTESHHLPYSNPYRENQGWQVAELVREPAPGGPIIRIFCGELVEEFSPMNLVTGGIGGSETAVIQMSSHWAKLGCQVVVYGNNVGIYDGVLYRYADEWSPQFYSNIFIAWRLPHLFAKVRPNSDVNVLWCHDIHYPIDVKPEWCDNIDVIAVLSEFHKDWIMKIHPFPEEKMWVTRNGIDPARYLQPVTKQKHHYFYSSSHERGLEELLLLWPQVKKAIPDAVLHIGYGTYTAAMVMKDRGDQEGLDELRGLEQLMYDTDGIVYHGRMNQWELAKVQLECEAWLYPYQSDEKWQGNGGFLETYCITALEAQAAGCVPVTRLNGALPEVIKSRVEWTGEWTVKDLIETLKYIGDEDPRANIKGHKNFDVALKENRKWAFSQSWESLAVEWLKYVATIKQENNEQLHQPARDLAGSVTE